MSNLKVERREENERTGLGGGIMPPGDDDYWAYRVRLTDRQSVIGFPKFGTIGIGFAHEEDDWNTNFPYRVDAEDIFQHISRNKGDGSIPDDDVRAAIRLIQAAASADRNGGR